MEEARKVIIVVAKVEREEQGNDERATNVVRQCRQGTRQGGQRTENRNSEKNKEEGSNTARHFLHWLCNLWCTPSGPGNKVKVELVLQSADDTVHTVYLHKDRITCNKENGTTVQLLGPTTTHTPFTFYCHFPHSNSCVSSVRPFLSLSSNSH